MKVLKQNKLLIILLITGIIILGILFPVLHTESKEVVISNPVTITKDLRAEKIDKYFKDRNEKLAGYGNKFVEMADKYNLPYNFLPAISVRETTGGNVMCTNPKAKNNPFGYGSCRIGFNSINEAIETVSYKLSNLPVYKGKTIQKKLYYYNGTVIPSYPQEVLKIMKDIDNK